MNRRNKIKLSFEWVIICTYNNEHYIIKVKAHNYYQARKRGFIKIMKKWKRPIRRLIISPPLRVSHNFLCRRDFKEI